MNGIGRYAGYRIADLRKDLLSGLIVGIIAIPLGMAFAIASGAKPEYGLYTTIIAGILISLFGGSKFQIGGPTGAFIPILLAIVMQYGYDNLLLAGMMAGLMLVLMGLFGLGALIKFIPRSVTVGFTAGIAVLIFSGQIVNVLGLTGVAKHEDFYSNMKEIGIHIGTLNGFSLLTAAVCLAVLLLMPKLAPKVPASLLGLILSSVVAAVFYKGQVATIGSSYGPIPGTLPQLHLPEITWERLRNLLQPAFVIAMLGGIESLLSAVVADGMTGSRHNSNRELIGQGIANLAAPLFGGIPATGAIARTATNIKSGAASPLSGVIHGLVVLLVLVLFAPYASHIPLASMAPVLMLVAWNMSERKSFRHLLRAKTGDSLVLLLTFLLTVFTSLATAVAIGLLVAVILFAKRMSEVLKVAKALPDHDHKHAKVRANRVREGHDCPQINLYTIEGPLFFGAADKFEQSVLDSLPARPGILLLRMGKVPFIDATGEASLASLIQHIERLGGKVLLSGVQEQPLEIMKRTGLLERIHPAHRFDHTGEAIQYALQHLNLEKCKGCRQFAFRECAALSSAAAPESDKA
ncbi:Sulfate permease [Paenibacillus pasadenensis]|uniref:Sulfate permease n=1 Tax=Paenibacillus pasadenensis TaxID=217090 RepID=A0A2N5MZY5_9BACL|nr:sulfate permease [Paenibacillus pasadenensis]PLT43646.1 Sulfate permease [Paenibacillus pasadenensis]